MAQQQSITLSALKREDTGKRATKAVRKDGRTPAIIYGNKKEQVAISLDQKDLFLAHQTGRFLAQIVNIEVDGKTIQTLPKDVQAHPVSDVPLHVDFLAVDDNTKVQVLVKVKFINDEKSPGLKRGGILNAIRRDIALWCKASNIPAYLEVDLEGMKIGESIHVSKITLPEGSSPVITDRDFTIATITGKVAEVEEEEGEGEGEEEGAEGEASAEGGDSAGDAPAEEKSE